MARTDPALRIGIFGLRGLAPDLEITGFETAFAEIAPRLVARGHAVTIYCRSAAHSASKRPAKIGGIALNYMPSPGGKNFSALISTFLAVLHGLATRRFDVWLFVNVGMGHHCALARLSGRPVVMNVDGLDWTRAKWGPLARTYFRSAARSAVRYCTTLITDAVAMQEFYRAHFHRDSEMIAYGATIEDSRAPEHLEPFGVTPGAYDLIVSRLIPENSLEQMLDGFTRSASARQLLVVGGANYEDAFHQRLRAIAERDARIRLLGQITDQDVLRELWCNAHVYLHGHSVGGTNPALLRAMGYGRCVLALDTVFNREVLVDRGRFFTDAASLAVVLNELDTTPDVVKNFGAQARERVREHYDWDAIADRYESVLRAATFAVA